jgi:hypothetical protein
VTGRAFPSGIIAGDTYQVPGAPVDLSAVVIKDSAGSPRTLVAGTDYTLDAKYGLVTFKASGIAGSTQPFKVDFTSASSEQVAALTQATVEKFLFFRGINIADGGKPVICEIYRAQLNPASKLPLKQTQNEAAMFEINFSMLDDSTKAEDSDTGRYLRYRILA